MTSLTTIFSAVGLIRLSCSPHAELWLWAKGLADDNYLTQARVDVEWLPTKQQIEYWSNFVKDWSNNHRLPRADKWNLHKARTLWLI